MMFVVHEDRPAGFLFACSVEHAAKINLHAQDAPRQPIVLDASGRTAPAPATTLLASSIEPEVWSRLLAPFTNQDPLTFVRENDYGTAKLFRLNTQVVDALGRWTPETADEWEMPEFQRATDHLMSDARLTPIFKRGGVAGALLHARGVALKARADKGSAAVYYYWYAPLNPDQWRRRNS